mgnify:CR=1 FL=1
MSAEPPEPEPRVPDADAPFDPVRERKRILAQVRGRTLDAHQAELLCTTIAFLAEIDPRDGEPTVELTRGPLVKT